MTKAERFFERMKVRSNSNKKNILASCKDVFIVSRHL